MRIMGMDIDIGVLLPTGQAQWGAGGDPRELVAFAVRAEQLGFSSLFVNDTLISPRIEALTMLAALAPVTQRVTLGTGALLPFLRRPIQAAQALASVDLLSGGPPPPPRGPPLPPPPPAAPPVPPGAPADLARRRDPGRARPHRTALRRLAALPARPRRLRIRPAGDTESGGPGRTRPRRHHPRAVRVRASRQQHREWPPRTRRLRQRQLRHAAGGTGKNPGDRHRHPPARHRH